VVVNSVSGMRRVERDWMKDRDRILTESEGKGHFAYILALPATPTRGPVQEVLLKAITYASAKLRRRAAQLAVNAVASIGVITLGIRPHNCLTLLVTRCALSTRALKTRATA
jgi:hypothetical protein